MDYVKQPRATYCRPEIASVGLTEQQCEERGLPIKVGKVPFQAIAKAIIGGEYEGFAKVIGNTETERHARRPHHRPARDGPDRRGVARPQPRGDAVGDRRVHAPAPDALARSSARPRWRSTAGRSTSSHGARSGDRRSRTRPTEDAMTVTDRSGDAAASPLAASVGLTDADLIGMYRIVALARAVDERMWILNRAGRIPFVISGQGHEGAQAGIAWPLEKGHDWIAPFYRSIATCLDVRHERARHPDRAVRQGDRPLVGRPPDARPLRQRATQPGVGVVAGRDPDAARRRHRARRQDPQDGPGRDDVDGRGLLQPGRRPRGPQLRRDPQAAVHLRRREQRLRDQRAGREGAGRQGRRDPRRPATASRA